MSMALDALLGITLLWLAWRALNVPELFRAIVLFMAFGLLMALAWARLDAPDIALAEAAVGAGLTGVLLLAALGDLRGRDAYPDRSGLRRSLPMQLTLLLAAGGMLVMLGLALFSLPQDQVRLGGLVTSRIGQAAASHPVTAVLLDFRAWDTLLEIAVLLLAVIASWSLGHHQGAVHIKRLPGHQVLQGLVRILLPFFVLVAGYLVWRGAHAPGGAFQAGTVLAAAGLLLLMAGLFRPVDGWHIGWRASLASGLLLFIAVALATLWQTGALDYPPGSGPWLVLLIELGLSVSIGLTFIALFTGERRRRPR